MTIDVFGHGTEDPLPPLEYGVFHHGADRLTGPHRCRGGTKPCSGLTSDHMCCCDACRHKDFFTCDIGCCKCLPLSICAVFTPNVIAGKCQIRSYKMRPTAEEGNSSRVYYSFPISTNQVTLSVGKPSLDSSLLGIAECTWRMQYMDIDEEYEITHIDGHVNCLRLPDFSFAVDFPVGGDVCPGTITFDQFTYQKIPYRKRWQLGQDEIITLDTPCSNCLTGCFILAVKRGDSSTIGYEEATECQEFGWDETLQAWVREGEKIEHFEFEGACYLKLTTWNTATLEGDLIAIEECDIGMSLSIKDELDNWVQISCNMCSCWEHICGTCRCVCEKLCMYGIQGTTLLGPFELSWNSELLRWEPENAADAPIVGIGRKENGDCSIGIANFDPLSTEDDAQSVDIHNTCGDNIAFTFINSFEDQKTNGLKLWTAYCKQCEGSCQMGTCLSQCENVPKILYARVYPLAWTEMLGCEGFPATDCFEEFYIPMIQIFIPTVFNPSGEWRWIGAASFSCRSCGSSNYKNNTAIIDIGCDGTGSLTITGESNLGNNINESVTIDIDFNLPCEGAYGSWTLLGPWEERNASAMLCCSEAGWGVTISEDEPI